MEEIERILHDMGEHEWLRVAAVLIGGVLVFITFFWSLRILMVQGTDPPPVARLIFRGMRNTLLVVGGIGKRDGEYRRRVWQFYVPISLLAIITASMLQTLVGFTLIFWGLYTDNWLTSYQNSFSSLSTLGLAGMPNTLRQSNLALLESMTEPVLLALLITYFSTINQTFDDRTSQLRLMDQRLAQAVNGPMLLEHTAEESKGDLSSLHQIWTEWGAEFTRIDERYQSVEGYLIIFAPRLRNHWAHGAMTVLDAANLRNTVLDLPTDRKAEHCLQTGIKALTETTEHFKHHLLRFHRDDQQAEVSRAEFDTATQALVTAGLPLVKDIETAWTQFSTNRKLYETAVVDLCNMVYIRVSSWTDEPKSHHGILPQIQLFKGDHHWRI